MRNMAVTERDKFSEDLFCPCGLLSKYIFFFFRLDFYSLLGGRNGGEDDSRRIG